VRQKKTGRPVRFEMTEQTRQAIDDYIRLAGKKPGEFLFVGRRGAGQRMTTRRYGRLVSEWVASIGLDPLMFGTIEVDDALAIAEQVDILIGLGKAGWFCPAVREPQKVWRRAGF
jgi:hypothetical protein